MNIDAIDLLRQSRPVLTLLLTFSLTAILLPPLGRLASRIGLVDHPNSRRKIHMEPKPLVGGIAMSLAVAFSGLLFIPLQHLRGFYAAAVLLVITGFLDDFGELSHRHKFAAQIVAAAFLMFFSKVYLHTFGDLLSFGPISFDMLAVPVTAFSIVGVCNAVNMIDGLDGLAGGIGLTVFSSFAFLSYAGGQPTLLLLNLSFCGALAAFLIFNWHPSRLFMGDAGSIFLGFSAAFISIALTQGPDSSIPPVAPLLILAVPIVDTLTIMTRRLMKGRSPFHADKGHLHHVLLKMGYSKRQTALIIILLSAFFCSVAIAGTLLRLPEYFLFFFFLAYFFAYFTASFYVRKIIRHRAKLAIGRISPLF